MKMFAYTGDLKKLKTLDYKFQKLFASNHKNYSKNSISMFVVTKMALELRDLRDEHQTTLINFLLKNQNQPHDFWWEDRDIGPMMYKDAPKWYMTGHGNIVDKDEYFRLKMEFHDVIRDAIERRDAEKPSLSEDEFKKLVREAENSMEGAKEGYIFRKETVEQVWELNRLHPLETLELEEA